MKSAKFGVSLNGYPILRNFTTKNAVIKEYILRVDDKKLEVLFSPEGGSGFGFVNAIEVFSAPGDLIPDYGPRLLSPSGSEEFYNLSSKILETVHRINVGGSILTPFNDTLWRTWINDEDFLVLKSAAKPALTTHTPNYQEGGKCEYERSRNAVGRGQRTEPGEVGEGGAAGIASDSTPLPEGIRVAQQALSHLQRHSPLARTLLLVPR